MKVDIRREIEFNTSRSSGPGGQKVNKTETMVEGRWNPQFSTVIRLQLKERLIAGLRGKLSTAGYLIVKSQTYRSQLQNKEDVIRKINNLVSQALTVRKKRIPTHPSGKSVEKRLENKKRISFVKAQRRKPRAESQH